MKRAFIRFTIVAVLAAVLLTPFQAHAWGTRSMKSITAMSLQMLKQDFPNTFRPGGAVGVNFEKDVLDGANAGWELLRDTVPLNNDAETVQAVNSEILLLREARKFGPTSFFAFRMGVLASLTANVMVPYGFAWTPEEQAVRQKMFADIESNIDNYKFTPTQGHREFIRDGRVYFESHRAFYGQDKALIGNDYKTGAGYNGFLKQGGRAYFTRAVETVTDVWNTVLRADSGELGLSKPSQRALTWYFVDEIQFLLKNKGNMFQAEKVYANFEKVNPQLVDAYEKVGDTFYAFDGGRQAKERGLAEWELAYKLGGPERVRIGKKMSGHYLGEGRDFLEKAAQPGAEDTDLPNALNAFERALDYDRTSQDAAKLIQDTNVAIQERNERLEMTVNIISTGEKVRAEADNLRDKQDYANAIKTYRQAVGFFEAVDDEFKEQSNTAKENIRRLKKSIQDVINDVLDAASQAIDEGDRAKESNRFSDAIGAYQRVSTIVSVIPDDEHPTVLQDRQNMIDMAAKKTEEANVAKIRYEQAMAEQANTQPGQGARPGGAPAPGAAAPAAPGGAPAAPAAPAPPAGGLQPSVTNMPPPPNIPGLGGNK